MMAGFCASLAGTLMFISRLVGLEPKLVTRVSAPLVDVTTTARPARRAVEICITKVVLLDPVLAIHMHYFVGYLYLLKG